MPLAGEALDAGTGLAWLSQFGGAGADGIRSPGEIFSNVFEVFLLLGTVVGVVVISYTLYNAYKYRDGNGAADEKYDEPELGELPEGGGKGKKLFLSFGISAFIVLGLIIWTYGLLLDVENGVASQQAQTKALEDPLEVEVIGHQFSWEYVYPNNESTGTLRVPANRPVRLSITSSDVMHNFGIEKVGLKGDAIPGQYTHTWFVAEETGTYTARCYELCGVGHSQMQSDVVVMQSDEYQDWYENASDNA